MADQLANETSLQDVIASPKTDLTDIVRSTIQDTLTERLKPIAQSLAALHSKVDEQSKNLTILSKRVRKMSAKLVSQPQQPLTDEQETDLCRLFLDQLPVNNEAQFLRLEDELNNGTVRKQVAMLYTI